MIASLLFWKSSTKQSCFCGCARLSRDKVCTALMPESGLSTYIVCSSGSS